MLTYTLDPNSSDSLYESLYKMIRQDIVMHHLKPHDKLPSKRTLARHLNISTITVENAYAQLMAEGYIYSIPKSGFYVADLSLVDSLTQSTALRGLSQPSPLAKQKQQWFLDLVNNQTTTESFPFAIWSRLMRETMLEKKKELLTRSPSAGVLALRQAITHYLYQFRGLSVEPDQIIVGAGTEYLYGLIIQLLGQDKVYGVEDPGYQLIRRIYQVNQVPCKAIAVDEGGINVTALEASGAQVVHTTPSHHFPTGVVTPISRRYELLSWANQFADRYIIEDDYDSEFRFKGKPIPSLQSIDTSNKVIYINTFSKSLASTIRISYMVLPKPLMAKYQQELSFYACTVSNFEQYAMAKFIEQGYFERHINRMRTHYRAIRDQILHYIETYGQNRVKVSQEDAGLHFILHVDTEKHDEELIASAANEGIRISCLSEYYHDQSKASEHVLVISFAGLDSNHIEEGIRRLMRSILS